MSLLGSDVVLPKQQNVELNCLPRLNNLTFSDAKRFRRIIRRSGRKIFGGFDRQRNSIIEQVVDESASEIFLAQPDAFLGQMHVISKMKRIELAYPITRFTAIRLFKIRYARDTTSQQAENR